MSSPRIFGIAATRAPLVAVLRRGPSDWSHLGAWDVERGLYTPGAWIHGNLYPQRCDLSPDGCWFSYLTLKPSATWNAGPSYLAISRLPRLTALAAWRTDGTWTRGIHFVEDSAVWEVAEPDVGDIAPCRSTFGVALTRASVFAVERRRGWTETADSPPPRASDPWDEQRAAGVTMEKARPGSDGATRLTVQGYFAGFRTEPTGSSRQIRYEITGERAPLPLADAQWAEWAADGSLLVATHDGRLQIREYSGHDLSIRFEVDLAALTPAPSPPPPQAHRW
jgi:hypothetical protein